MKYILLLAIFSGCPAHKKKHREPVAADKAVEDASPPEDYRLDH